MALTARDLDWSIPMRDTARDVSHRIGALSLRLALPLLLAVTVWIPSAAAQTAETLRNGGKGEPGPVFSDTGPDAELFGAAAGYPVGSQASAAGKLEYLVGTYSHFGDVLPSRPIRRAETSWAFKRAVEPPIAYKFNSEQLSIADYLARNPVTGLLIARDDTILYEHYQYARSDRDRFVSQSMAKTVTAMLIGIAISEGKIKSVDDMVATYVPGLDGKEYGKTSIRHLLHMSSGVAFSEVYDGTDDISQLSRDLFGKPGKEPVASVAQFNMRAAPPGTKWHYASVESEILGLVLRSATGVPVADYFHDKIWSTIGTESDASWSVDGTGQETTFCCINATLRDYARLGRLLAHDGAWNGRQLIPQQWLLDATTVSPADSHLAPGTATPYFGFGYQTWLLPGAQRRFLLLGIRGQMILVDPASKLVMVQTAVFKKPAENGSLKEPLALWFAALAQLGKR